jgi:methionyl-tRNA formyltransferase
MTKIKKIVFVGHDNKGSAGILKQIINKLPRKEYLLIHAKGIYYKKTIIYSIIKLLLETSWIFIFVRLVDLCKHKLSKNKLSNIAKDNSIKRICTSDINEKNIAKIIKEFEPDLLVSLFTMQIYKNDVIKIPKFGAITSHPSILPNYRGLEVFFWVLANNEKETGVSVFFLTEKIDDGIVIWQRKIPIKSETTMDGLYDEITHLCAKGLIESILSIENENLKYIPQTGTGSYFKMPTRESVWRFIKNKRKFF